MKFKGLLTLSNSLILSKNFEEKILDRVFELAKIAYSKGEVPVAAVIVKDGIIISEAYNRKEEEAMSLNHAEILAIKAATKKLKTWRLKNCIMYVNLEPCLMCMGAIISSRISKLVFCAYDYQEGAINGRYKIASSSIDNLKLKIESGKRIDESAKLMAEFFSKIRDNKKLER